MHISLLRHSTYDCTQIVQQILNYAYFAKYRASLTSFLCCYGTYRDSLAHFLLEGSAGLFHLG